MTKAKTAAQAPLLDLQANPEPKPDQQPAAEKAAPEKPAPKPRAKAASTDVAVHQPQGQAVAPAGQAESMLHLIARAASDPRTNVEKMKALLDMQKEVMAIQAKADFDAAYARMQPVLPVIDKRGRIEIREKVAGERTGKVQQSTGYARFEDINEAVKPILADHGFGISFETSLASDGKIRVVGILSGYGHERRSEFILPHDFDRIQERRPGDRLVQFLR